MRRFEINMFISSYLELSFEVIGMLDRKTLQFEQKFLRVIVFRLFYQYFPTETPFINKCIIHILNL